MAALTVKTRVLIISDTHNAPLEGDAVPPFEAPLPAADLLIHCGDLTMDGRCSVEYQGTLDMLKEINAPVKLVIAGNHDRALDRRWMFSHMKANRMSKDETQAAVDEVKDLWTAPHGRAVQEGVTFLHEGNHQVKLPNGAVVNIYASPYTPEFLDWGFPYERDEDRFNSPGRMLSDAKNVAPFPIPSFTAAKAPVDIAITHGPPYARLDQTDKGELTGCPHLLRAVMRARPLIHCFGHIHEGWGAERVTWSKDADHVTEMSSTIAEWKDGSWEAGVAGLGTQIKAVATDPDSAKEKHSVFVDISQNGGNAVERGDATLMVNAAIMDVGYKPVNAPWIVDVDLPKAS